MMFKASADLVDISVGNSNIYLLGYTCVLYLLAPHLKEWLKISARFNVDSSRQLVFS